MLSRVPQASVALPVPHPEALAHSRALAARIADEIAAADGWIGFDHYMERVLYTPGLGYYSGGAEKFGAAGDFVTAPELGPLFAQTLAVQVAEILRHSAANVVEVGAGSGRLAADLLCELERLSALPAAYHILDLSGELRARQQATLERYAPHLASRVRWLDRLPQRFDGLVLANEVLDAMPVHLVHWCGETILERGVSSVDGQLVYRDRPAGGKLLDRARSLAADGAIAPGYVSELALAAPAWVAQWAGILGHGVLLLIDYGFPRHEYYHPQRTTGTLMCHYRHRAHSDPFYLPGLQDITAHVDFTAVVEAAVAAGLDLLGYTTQAAFLFNCGLTDVLARVPASDPRRYLPLANAAQKLISPAEMGELFKVIALGRGFRPPLRGFVSGDRSATL